MAIRHIRDLLPEVFDQIERRHEHKGAIAGIPTGFQKQDDILDGWQPQLYVLGGRPSMGKSALMKDWILAATRTGRRAHLVNIEDGNFNTAKRMLATMAEVDLWKVRKGIFTKEEYGRLVQVSGRLAELWITFDDSVSRVGPIMESIEEACGLGAEIVFIDYLQLIQGDRKSGKNRVEEIGDITRALKDLSKPERLNVPVVVTAQLSRLCETRENKRPILADLRDSGEIEQGADVVMFLFREGYYKELDNPRKTELIIAKGRNEGTATIFLEWNDMLTSFREWRS
ncbi:MAG: DnaB-like helicase C-terminal domain-containing protein [Nitrospirae bacterium]|nr:DnaB-like helicase C-terminal domain-containing protein [Nitrospirota bacterium]